MYTLLCNKKRTNTKNKLIERGENKSPILLNKFPKL